jgi:ligand-binding sensor domain-containing protein/two-component sensor histidine kinase
MRKSFIKVSLRRISIVIRSILLFNFFTIPQLYGQTVSSTEILTCNQIGQESGLLQLNVKSLVLDEMEYLWVGTEDGLHRFNGYEFTSYLHNPKDTNSIDDDHIRSLYFSSDTLWLATNTSGILGFDLAGNRFFHPLSTATNSEFNTGYKVISLNNNTLLFSVKNNLIIYDKNTGNTEVFPLEQPIKESFVTDVCHLNDTISWLASSASGIIELNKSNNQLSKKEFLKTKTINCLLKSQNEIFVGTEQGLMRFDLESKKLKQSVLTFPVNCFFAESNERFYIGTDVGLFLYDVKNKVFTPFRLQTGEARFNEKIDINQIIGDKKGNIWIGTEGDGIFHYNSFRKKFNTINLKLKEYPYTHNISTFQFLKDNDSSLWLGTKLGIVKYNFINHDFNLYSSTNQILIYTLVEDLNGTIWAGGFTSGLLKYNSKQDEFVKISGISSLPDNDVIEIIPINKNTLWVCTWSGGIHRYDIEKKEFEELLINRKRLNRVRTSLIDSSGNIWLGTDEGAFRVTPSGEMLEHLSASTSGKQLSGERVFNIKEDKNGNVWFGTNVGLTKLDIGQNKTFLYYQQKGLPNDFIYSVLIDENTNDIWVGTNFGLSVLNTETYTFRNFTVSDGLQNNEFNGKAAYCDESGNFYFGGMAGINIFNPGEIRINPFLPKVYIESVDLFNTPINKNELYNDTLVFKSRENVLTFNFAALNYLNPEKVSYQFKMEGFDEEWRPVTKNRNTTYTNLNPGEYSFIVKATNDAGIWSNETDSMVLVVVPPWYLSTYFKIALILIFLVSGYVFYFFQTQKLKKDKLKLEVLVAQRTKDVLQKNEELKQAFLEAEEQRDNINFLMKELRHRVKNNLQIISSLLNIQANTMQNAKAIDALRMAKNRILTLSHIENKISADKDFVQIDKFIRELSDNILLALTDIEKLKFRVVYQLTDTLVNSKKFMLIGLILNELITNTAKHAFNNFNNENELRIECFTVHERLRLIVSDNGLGYNEKDRHKSNSIGIDLINDMVLQLNGTIKTESKNGTKNFIDIPI